MITIFRAAYLVWRAQLYRYLGKPMLIRKKCINTFTTHSLHLAPFCSLTTQQQTSTSMPFYEIQHVIPITPSQEDALAQAITTIHLQKFPLVPTFFVNVVFTDTSSRTAFVGGKRRRVNHLTGRLRLGDRTTKDFEDMRDQLEAAWEEIIVKPVREKRGVDAAKEYELQTLVLSPGNPVGKEGGFEIPIAGEERAWLEKYWGEFKRKADAGDEQFVDMVKAVEAKGLM